MAFFVGVSQCIGVIDKLKSYEIVDKYKIITVDTYPEVLELLNAGIITATLDRRPYDMGQLAFICFINTLIPGSFHLSGFNPTFYHNRKRSRNI